MHVGCQTKSKVRKKTPTHHISSASATVHHHHHHQRRHICYYYNNGLRRYSLCNLVIVIDICIYANYHNRRHRRERIYRIVGGIIIFNFAGIVSIEIMIAIRLHPITVVAAIFATIVVTPCPPLMSTLPLPLPCTSPSHCVIMINVVIITISIHCLASRS